MAKSPRAAKIAFSELLSMSAPPTRDEVLRRMLKTPPKPFTPKAKPKAAKTKKKKA
jgi:hypothetical protein